MVLIILFQRDVSGIVKVNAIQLDVLLMAELARFLLFSYQFAAQRFFLFFFFFSCTVRSVFINCRIEDSSIIASTYFLSLLSNWDKFLYLI